MEGRGKSRRRNPFKVWKRRMGAVMSVILTISIIFNMPLSLADFGLHVSNAYASGSNANREDSVWATASNAKYKAGSSRDVDIYVVAEDSEAAAGNMSTMTLYLRNNTQEEISDGILKFKGNHIAKEDGYFTDIQADADAEVSVISGGTDDETEASGEGLLYQEGTLEAAGAGNLDGNADGDNANIAAAGAEMSVNTVAGAAVSENAADMAADDAGVVVDNPDAESPEDEFDEIDEGDEAAESDEDDEEETHTLTDISLAPGELYEIRFEFYTDEEEKSTKAYVKFTFEGEGSEGKVKGEEKFYYSIGLPYVNIELADGYEIETGVQNEMNIWMSEPTWMDEALEERVEAIEEAKAEAEENESESDETEETAIATKSTADKASDSNADLAQSDAEQSDAQQSGTQQSNGQQSGTQQSDTQVSADDTSDKEKIEKFTQEAMTISESKVSYEVEVWGAEYKKFRPKKAEEAEDIGWISCLYQVAENTRPGVYYGKVSASGKWNQKAFASQQGFFFEVTGEGNIVLESNAMDGMTVLVSGPVSSFPEAEELSVSVSSVPEEMKPQVEEALKKRAEEEGFDLGNYRALDIRLYADGEETEPTGEIQVSFKNMELTEQVDGDTQISRTAVKAAVNEDAAEGAPQSNEEAGIALLSNDAESTAVKDSENIKVYHLDEEETVANEMESSVEDNGDVVMTTDHFSVYIVVLTNGATDSIDLTVQHYAYLDVLSDNPESTLTGGNTASGINTNNTLKLNYDKDEFWKIYSEDVYEIPEWQEVNISQLSKVEQSGAYTISEIYLLNEGKDESDDMSDTDIWKKLYQVPESTSGDLEDTTITISRDSTIRIVYEPVSGTEDAGATFYDYTIWENNRNLLNNQNNSKFANNKNKKWFGIGNYLAGVDESKNQNQYRTYYNYVWSKYNHPDSQFDYDFNIWRQSTSKEISHFVSGFENGKLIYTDNAVVDVGVFDPSVPGVNQVNGYQLHFKKNGDTYVLSNVLDDNGDKIFKNYELDGFHIEKPGENHIYTNGFWALDGIVRDSGKDTSLDNKKHNWFFSMRYDFTFTLGDYTGPLTYYFRGDDDFWLFVDGKLAVDLGGIHDPVGEMIDLSDYINMTDKTTPHQINIVYFERGGNASTCYMEFTLPNVESIPFVPDETEKTSLTVTKKWNDYNNPFRPESISVQLQFKADDESDWIDWGGTRTITEGLDGEWEYTWEGLPVEGYAFRVEEVVPEGYTVTYGDDKSGVAQLENGKYTFEITNTMEPPLKDLTVEKKWIDQEGNALTTKPDSIQVRLYWKGADEGTNQWKVVNGKNSVELNEANGWTYIFENLPANLEYLSTVYRDVDYTVFELDSRGQKIDDDGHFTLEVDGKTYAYVADYVTTETTATPSPDGQISDDQIAVTVTNTLTVAELRIHKVNAKNVNENLQGVKFTLELKESNDTYTLISDVTTDAYGIAIFENLNPGNYRLTETEAAPGYYLPGEPWEFSVNERGEIIFTNTNDASYANDSGEMVLTITNQPGVELPETGGPGLIMMERFGWMLLLLAMLGAEIQIFGSKRKREE